MYLILFANEVLNKYLFLTIRYVVSDEYDYVHDLQGTSN